MGSRLYDPFTGQFTSPDPIPGGNATSSTYPDDPINTEDPSGNNLCATCGEGGSGPAGTISIAAPAVATFSAAALILQYAKAHSIAIPQVTSFNKNKFYSVYSVSGVNASGKSDIWKYGITSQLPYTKRASVGVKHCEQAGWTGCRANFLSPADGYYKARLEEFPLIVKYALKHKGKCPAGHKLWCK